MSKLKILDTGYNTSDRQSNPPNTPLSGTNIEDMSTYIAYAGVEIPLNLRNVRMRSGMNVSDEPNPSSNQVSQVHFTTFTNRIFEIDFIIDVTNADQREQLKNIVVLERTKGLKLIYDTDTTLTIKQLTEIIGRTNTNFNTGSLASIPVIMGRVIGTSINSISGSRKFQVSGTLTFEESK